MPARSGQEYIDNLSANPAEVWIGGEKVKDVTTHPAFQNGVRSLAALYDLQHNPNTKDTMTFESPRSGDPVGLSFIVPKSIDDLVKRREMMTAWAWESCGMMARTPDFLNCAISGWAGSAEYFSANRADSKDNVLRYHDYIRENDLTLTHTLVNLQRSRNPSVLDKLEDQVALTVVKETDSGIVVHGSRTLATLGPISDEIAVYPTRTHLLGEEARKQAFSFALPCTTPGMRFMCRESLDMGRSHFDHPLGSRFEEMDSLVFFDNVFVPWERVFLLGDVDLCNNFAAATQSTSHTGHQVVNRTVVKTEFLLGLTSLMAETLGSTQVPHVQERIGEIVVNLEVMKACVRAAEADAKLNEWGVMCPAFGPLTAARAMFSGSMYPRMAEIVQLLGSSSLMGLPSEADFAAEIAPELDRYLATDSTDARGRVRLFHLAWDVACSAFGGRQTLYERFFGGDPVRNTMLLYQGYNKTPAMERVQKFLEREG